MNAGWRAFLMLAALAAACAAATLLGIGVWLALQMVGAPA
jgi:hypothetical protein